MGTVSVLTPAGGVLQAAPPGERIVPRPTEAGARVDDRVVAFTAVDPRAARPAVEQIVALLAVEEILAVAAQKRVVAGIAVQRVVAVAAVERVGERIAQDRVRQRVARAVHCSGTEQRQLLEPGAERPGDVAGDGVDAGVGSGIRDRVAGRYEIAVRPGATVHGVAAGAADERI